MNFVIRVDGCATMGGGHIMRCLTLAKAAQGRGHKVTFVCAQNELTNLVSNAGFDLVSLSPQEFDAEPTPTHAHWLRLPWQRDAVLTGEVAQRVQADWIIWDHYGLDARWVDRVRAMAGQIRVLAMDDLDDRDLGSDLVLDQTRILGHRTHQGEARMTGPTFALLRPEFSALRPAALDRRESEVRRILITPGMVDMTGLAPLALDALNDWPGKVEVIMGRTSPSLAAVEQRISGRADRYLTLDAADMAQRFADSDFCVGTSGMTTWERCCLGLPSVLVAVADNQVPVAQAIAERGAAVVTTLAIAADTDQFRKVILDGIERASDLSQRAAKMCDGSGAQHVLNCLMARLRPLGREDTQRLYDWRLSPRIRAASLQHASFSFDSHRDWVARTLARQDGVWRIYEEPDPVGFVGASDQGDGTWSWSFYIGSETALKGAGARMLTLFLKEVWKHPGCHRIKAVVLKGNTASAGLHRTLGFRQIETTVDGQLVFMLDRPVTVSTPQG